MEDINSVIPLNFQTVNPNLTETPVAPPVKKTRTTAAIIVGLIFAILYGIALMVILPLIGLGCYGSCLLYVGLRCLTVIGILSILHFFLFKAFLPYKKRYLVLLILANLIAGTTLAPLLYLASIPIMAIGARARVEEMYAPSTDAQKFHPAITFNNHSLEKNSEDQIVAIKVNISITADMEGTMEVTGGLYDSIPKEGYSGTPIARDLHTIKIGRTPVDVSFRLPTKVGQKLDIFGVFMYYLPDMTKYNPDAVDRSQIKNLQDSGKSKTLVLPNTDKQKVYYKINLD